MLDSEKGLIEKQDEIVDDRKWTSLQFDSQILSKFMECPREMQYRFIQHLVPIGGVSKGIEKGTLCHKGLQTFYELMKKGDGFSIRKLAAINAMKEIAPTLSRLEGEDVVDVIRTFEEYCEYRKNDVFEVVFTERVFKKIIYEVFPLRIYITGRIDMGILDFRSSKVEPWDHKSESEHWFYSSLSNQFRMYALACDTNTLTVNRFGFQKTLKAEKKFKREIINFDPDALDEFKNETIPYYAKQMLIAMQDNYFPPNHTACIKGHFACIFSDKHGNGICNQTREIRDEKIQRYFEVKEWHPEADET